MEYRLQNDKTKFIPIEIQDKVLIPIETKFIPIGTKKKFSGKTSKTNTFKLALLRKLNKI